eukprot:1156653-Pelagomonas_calceolata.AAC.5
MDVPLSWKELAGMDGPWEQAAVLVPSAAWFPRAAPPNFSIDTWSWSFALFSLEQILLHHSD